MSRAAPSRRAARTSPTRWCGWAWSSDRTEAFATLLNPGRPGYVNRYASPLEETIPIVAAAGGVPVIAHPWGRRGGTVLDESALATLKDLGLAGIEVDHQDHPPELRDAAARHRRRPRPRRHRQQRPPRPRQGRPRPGVNTTDPEQYERLVSLAGNPLGD